MTKSVIHVPPDDQIRDVRVFLFEESARTGKVPQPEEIAAGLGLSLEDTHACLHELANAKVIIMAPFGHNIWAANPFCAVPTDFRVVVADTTYWGICIWDALGIPAALGEDGVIETFCADCREPMTLKVEDGELVNGEGVIHFAVPARSFWDNIAFA